MYAAGTTSTSTQDMASPDSVSETFSLQLRFFAQNVTQEQMKRFGAAYVDNLLGWNMRNLIQSFTNIIQSSNLSAISTNPSQQIDSFVVSAFDGTLFGVIIGCSCRVQNDYSSVFLDRLLRRGKFVVSTSLWKYSKHRWH